MKIRKIISFSLLVLLFTFGFVAMQKPVSAQTFSDVNDKQYYYEAVEYLAKQGIISSETGKFNPDNPVTRGQLAKMLAEALKLDTTNVKNPNFKDVPTSHQYYPYIAALANKKIINGYTDGTFGVNKNVTKAHLAKFIVNGFEMPIRSERKQAFKDVKPGTEADTYAGTLYFYRITWTEKYNPNANARRNVVASFIYEAIKKKDSIANQVEIKLPHKVTGQTQEYYTTSSTKAEGNVDINKGTFVLMPNGEERNVFYPFTNKKNKIVQFEVDSNNKVVHISLADKVNEKYKRNYPDFMYWLVDWDYARVTDITIENVSHPSLPVLHSKEIVMRDGYEYYKFGLEAAYGDKFLSSIYRSTEILDNGAVRTETFLFKSFTNAYYRIPLTEIGEEAFSRLVSPNEDYVGDVKVRVDGPSTYDTEGHLDMNGVIGAYTVYAKDLGVYKIYLNDKLNKTIEVFEVNGKRYGMDY